MHKCGGVLRGSFGAHEGHKLSTVAMSIFKLITCARCATTIIRKPRNRKKYCSPLCADAAKRDRVVQRSGIRIARRIQLHSRSAAFSEVHQDEETVRIELGPAQTDAPPSSEGAVHDATPPGPSGDDVVSYNAEVSCGQF